MTVLYNHLWKLLDDQKLSKADLRKFSGVTPDTMRKLRQYEKVSLSVREKIYKIFRGDYGYIIGYVYEGNE